MSLWGGRFKEETDKLVRDFTSSLEVDLWRWIRNYISMIYKGV